jgi:hypothetical protein
MSNRRLILVIAGLWIGFPFFTWLAIADNGSSRVLATIAAIGCLILAGGGTLAYTKIRTKANNDTATD